MMLTVVKHRSSISHVLIDTYSTQNFYYAVAIGNLCRLFKIPYIPILHGGNLPHRLQHSKSQSYKLFNGALTNVAPSQYLKHEFEKEGYDKLTYIPNTIAISDYPFLKRSQLRPKLLWVRSFAEIYHPMLALKVVERLMEELPDIELCMVGPDKDGSLAKCKQYVDLHKLPVHFTGKLSKHEWRELSKGYDLFINTTNFDNMPVSVIEAMALGLPIVSTNVGGIPYLIDHGNNGILVPPNDVDGMATAIRSLLNDPVSVQELTHNARQKVEGYDWEIVKLDWGGLLKE